MRRCRSSSGTSRTTALWAELRSTNEAPHMRTTTHRSFPGRAGAAAAACTIMIAAPLAVAAPLAAQGRLADEATIIRVAKQATPAVVSVTDPGVGLGSGVIIRADGVIITNAH